MHSHITLVVCLIIDEMGISNGYQFTLFLWKNWLLFKKERNKLLVSILFPMIFMFQLATLRSVVVPASKLNSTEWPSFEANTSIPKQLRASEVLQWELAYTPSRTIVTELVSEAARLIHHSTSSVSQVDGIKIGRGKRIHWQSFCS